MKRIRKRFASIFRIFVAGDRKKYGSKPKQAAREATVPEINMPVNPPRQAKATYDTTCSICLDDIKSSQMFYVDNCRHQFCYKCVKQHIETRLVEGYCVISCLNYRCKSKLDFGSCANLLKPNLRMIWQERIKENSIPVSDRIYCPNPRCSTLMSLNELTKSTKEAEVRKCCIECGESFCINCKVSWHMYLSCYVYKRLHPYLTENDGKIKALADKKLWRQCGKCQHMIELSKGCVQIQCRCGHRFCYLCGADAGDCHHGHYCPPRPIQP